VAMMENGDTTRRLGTELARVGARLRALRRDRGWRLEDLAERTGFSKAYLSRLESGERQPSLGALIKVAQAYEVDFSTLFEPEPGVKNAVVVRGSESEMRCGNGLSYANLTAGSWTFNLRPLLIVVPGEREEEKLYQHEGEQWLYVLSGRLRLKLADKEFVLEPGDSAHFDAERPHQLSALDKNDAEIILVACSVPYLLLRSYL
jgi:transcriptional regulator with XRE-family HTH domain